MSVARKLLKQKTARDIQRLAGPSSLGSACDACVARALSNEGESKNYYWVGATVGTAIHALLEERGKKDKNVLLEHNVTVGDIPGYGVIRGSVDRFEKDSGTVRDFKTTLKSRVPAMKKAYDGDLSTNTAKEAHHKILGYLGQSHLYGKALVNEGYTVNQVALDFICRDGSTDADVFDFVYDFDIEFANAIWERVLYIWNNLETETFVSDPYCIDCMLR